MKSNYLKSLYLKNTIYSFIVTSSNKLISKIKSMSNDNIVFQELETFSPNRAFLFINRNQISKNGVVSMSVVNDIGDYDITHIISQLLDDHFVSIFNQDSLLSLSCVNKRYFACVTDFWGIMTHYWTISKNTFVCSNNIFLVSDIIGNELCNESLYEYLFFMAPRKDNTWFTNVQCLLPGQQLIYDLKYGLVKLSKSTDFNLLFEFSEKNISETVFNFFKEAKEKIGNTKPINIALSAGSDSRTVLACLRHFGMNPNAITFGKNDSLESHLVKELVEKLDTQWTFVDLKDFESDFENLFSTGTFISNGLLNPFRTHYCVLYNQIYDGSPLFEGILGSEFVKGEIAVDAMISKLHNDVIANGTEIEKTIEKYYSEISIDLKKAMANYIKDKYGKELFDINSAQGLNCYHQYSLEFIPSRIFGPLILLQLANGISPYHPFISPNILKSIFSSGQGIGSSVSLRNDFVGGIGSIRVEAEIVKDMDKRIFNSLLDRGISFKDALSPLFFAKIRKKYNRLKEKTTIKRHFKPGQIDNSKIIKITEDIANKVNIETFPLFQGMKSQQTLTTKAMVNLFYVFGVKGEIV